MTNIVLMMALWWVPTLLTVLTLWWMGRVDIKTSWLGTSILIYSVYTGVIFSGFKIPFMNWVFPDPAYNWNGKLTAILATFILIGVIAAVSGSNWKDFGITFHQREGSMRPAFIATIGMMLFMALIHWLVNSTPKADIESITYQSTIPGLDEELFFRGLLLFTMSQAIRGKEFSVFGASVGWAAILVTLLFGLGHSLLIDSDRVQFDLASLILVSILGSILMWIRLRTGSLLLPIIAHNLTNLTGNIAPTFWTSE